jgi:hypothetical protein
MGWLEYTTTIAYGANGSFVYKTLAGGSAYGCNTGTFQQPDPAPGVTKACYFPLPDYLPGVSEGQSLASFAQFTPFAYGANGHFFYGATDPTTTCSNGLFMGRDPAPGIVKTCYVLGNPVSERVAIEGHSYGDFGVGNLVIYGNPFVPNFLYAGAQSGTCSNSFFGGDPAIGSLKSCWLDVIPPG